MDNQTICDSLSWMLMYASIEAEELNGTVFGKKLDNVRHACEEAIKIVKAQEPTKPKLGGDAGPFGTQWYQCGACSGQIDPGDKYCRTCGRAVKWE